MAKHIDYLTYDGRIYAVFTYRTEQTVLGTAWRFIMDDRKTLVLVPFQTPKNVPASPGVVPESVSSVFDALAGLAFRVLRAYSEGDSPPSDTGVFCTDTKLMEQDTMADKATLDLIQVYNRRWQGKRLPVAQLKRLRLVLFNAARRNDDNTTCSHSDLCGVIDRWKEVTGSDPTESILLEWDSRMRNAIEERACQTAKAERLSKDEARRLLLRRVNYVATPIGALAEIERQECLVLLQDARLTVHNKEDEDEFRRVAPTEAEREAIEVEKEKLRLKGLSERATPSEAGGFAEYDFVNLDGTEWRKGGSHMKRRKELAELQRMNTDDSGFRDHLESYPERRFYPAKKIEAVRTAHQRKERLPCEALYDVTQWIEDWKPPSAPNWRHPGCKSVPKAARQG